MLFFLKAPSESELEKRLIKRKSENSESINKRLQRLPFEYSLAEKFDHIIINDDLESTVKRIESIIIEK